MANYTVLKAAIADVVKTNGNNEITGQLLQDALLSIINNVGKGATYLGNATPGTSPGVQDGNVFYIAFQKGVYPNFGGVEVTGDIATIKNSVDGWVIDNINFIADGIVEPGNSRPTSGNTVSKVKNDLIKFVLGGDIDLETKPELTDGYYINNTGQIVTTSPAAYSATMDFIPLYGAKKLHYFGRFGNSDTRLVFYSGTSIASRVLVVPQPNREIVDEIFDIPVEAKYYRVTCAVNAKNNFKVVLIGVGSSLELQSFRFVGTPVYENDAIKQSNIIWNDGSSGVVIFNNWNEENLTFTSFVATSIENGVTVTQPPVTFNSNNQITNYPNFIISEI